MCHHTNLTESSYRCNTVSWAPYLPAGAAVGAAPPQQVNVPIATHIGGWFVMRVLLCQIINMPHFASSSALICDICMKVVPSGVCKDCIWRMRQQGDVHCRALWQRLDVACYRSMPHIIILPFYSLLVAVLSGSVNHNTTTDVTVLPGANLATGSQPWCYRSKRRAARRAHRLGEQNAMCMRSEM